tara:strand:+ start:1695 stop:2639 length:945 start_codon:yes stop_codon:yes gene_type:complete
MSNKIKKVSIIGSGPAGYTAAIYSARSGLEPLMISGLEPGGQLTITTDVENFPGFEKPIQGPWLMEQMKKQAESFGTQINNDFVKEVDFKTFPYKIKTEKLEIESYSIIIATGAKAKWLGIKGESEFMGLGVSACATCDGFFFKGKEVIVVGGGNTAVEEALFLSNLCNKVTLIHRRDQLRAEKILQNRLAQKKNVEILWNSTVDEIIGDKSKKCIKSAVVSNTLTKKKIELNLDGFFVAIGHSPTTEIFRKSINMDEEGYILTEPNSTKTNIEGIFAAGDVTDKVYRQAITAAGLGCMGAMEAKTFLSSKKII